MITQTPKRRDRKRNSTGGRSQERDAQPDAGDSYSSSYAQAGPPAPPPQPQPEQGKLADKAAAFDKIVQSDAFMERVYDRVVGAKYPNSARRDESQDQAYRLACRRIGASDAAASERMLWENVVTKQAAEKICHIINHIISSGPLTEGEIDILDRCVVLLKTYYIDRAALIKSDKANKNYYYKNTYFPPVNTFAYKIFISKYDMARK
ncbi:hypothetical protein PAPHI01_2174 [Pancytospora philotis]|nr:hypothetical protein PAPHI01_2174 [Pancytospora philotis]